MSIKHTPGPWYYHRQSSPNIYAEDGTQIGGANVVDDGLLIAAAPDLLAALEHLVEQVDDVAMTEHSRNAIKKARGEE
jgi:hypothetical protein